MVEQPKSQLRELKLHDMSYCRDEVQKPTVWILSSYKTISQFIDCIFLALGTLTNSAWTLKISIGRLAVLHTSKIRVRYFSKLQVSEKVYISVRCKCCTCTVCFGRASNTIIVSTKLSTTGGDTHPCLRLVLKISFLFHGLLPQLQSSLLRKTAKLGGAIDTRIVLLDTSSLVGNAVVRNCGRLPPLSWQQCSSIGRYF